MTTGIASWDGTIADIGPIYPFVGWEGVMVIICVVFWIGWHYLQIKLENRMLDEQVQALRQGGNLQQALQDEHTPQRM